MSKYSSEFKLEVIKYYLENNVGYQTAIHFNLAGDYVVSKWERIYYNVLPKKECQHITFFFSIFKHFFRGNSYIFFHFRQKHGSFLPILGCSFTIVLFIPPSFCEIFPSTRFIAVSSSPAPVTFATFVL